MNKHGFKVGDQVYIVESDFCGRTVQTVIAVNDDETEMPIVVEMSNYVGGNVVRAFRPSELRRHIDISAATYSALIMELVDDYNVHGDRSKLTSELMDLIDEIRFLAVCGDKATINR